MMAYILHTIARPKDLAGVRIAVTAGPTQEALDPVRYLTNHSTGKMGYALARAAAMRGADVTLIHGQTALPPVKFTTDVPVTTARQMYEAVTDRFDTTDVLIMAAAVADYRPATVANDKIKKKEGDLSIPVERARALGFDHPITGEHLYFESPLPEYFTGFLKTLKPKEEDDSDE